MFGRLVDHEADETELKQTKHITLEVSESLEAESDHQMENGDNHGESSYSNADKTEIPKNKTTMESEALAKGLSSTLTTIIKDFDSKAQQTFASQHQLSEALDRLTRELDKLLEDAPMPFIMQHAAKITAVRKRVLSLNSVLKNVQRRLDNIDRILTVGVPHQNQHEKSPKTTTEHSGLQ